ncbi:unnamed protein product, partial [Discosporangium mesarthrocarpum]
MDQMEESWRGVAMDSEEEDGGEEFLSAGLFAYKRSKELLQEMTESVESPYNTPYDSRFNDLAYGQESFQDTPSFQAENSAGVFPAHIAPSKGPLFDGGDDLGSQLPYMADEAGSGNGRSGDVEAADDLVAEGLKASPFMGESFDEVGGG